MKTIQEKFGETVVRLRKERGISQEGLALDAGIDRRYMSDIENGKRNVSIEIVERIAKALKVEVKEMF